MLPDRTDMEVAEHAEKHVETGFEIHCVEEKLTDKDDDPSILPSSSTSLAFDIEIEATQAPKRTPVETGNFVVDTNFIGIGETIPEWVNVRNTPEEAMADWQYVLEEPGATRPIYLKLVLNESDEIEEQYVGFVITDALKAQWKENNCSGDIDCETKIDNLVNGTYYLKASIYEYSEDIPEEEKESEWPIYYANKNVLKNAFNYTAQPDLFYEYTSDNTYHFGASVDVLSVEIYVNGDITVGDTIVGMANKCTCGGSECHCES